VLMGASAAILAAGRPSAAQPAPAITVAAAADLQAALPEVASRFQRDTGAIVKLSFGSSGNLFSQIQNGAPFDVFLSADMDYPRQLVASGHAEANSLYEYASGRVVLWTRNDSGIDLRNGLAVLNDSRVRRIAIANPAHAPYGRAAVAALRHEKLYEAVQGKLVLGENVSQAAQFVESGNADAGIIALSLALGPALRARGTYVPIPTAAHAPIRQAGVVISASRNKPTALQFIAYLKRPEIMQMLERFGLHPPQAAGR